jgi:hypothetical protein
MSERRSFRSISRRVAVTGIGGAVLGAAVSELPGHAAARQSSLATHPLIGSWLVLVDGSVTVFQFAADGTAHLACPVCSSDDAGDTIFTSSGVGTWESIGERGGYYNLVHVLSDANGELLGTRSIHGYPKVSDDGESFEIDSRFVKTYVRNSSSELVAVAEDAPDPAIVGIRMRPGSPGFPGLDGSPAEQ